MKLKLIVLISLITSHCYAQQEGEIAKKYAFNKSIHAIKIRLTQLKQKRESLLKDKTDQKANKEALKKIDTQLVHNFNEGFELLNKALILIQARLSEIDEESDEFETEFDSLQAKAA